MMQGALQLDAGSNTAGNDEALAYLGEGIDSEEDQASSACPTAALLQQSREQNQKLAEKLSRYEASENGEKNSESTVQELGAASGMPLGDGSNGFFSSLK